MCFPGDTEPSSPCQTHFAHLPHNEQNTHGFLDIWVYNIIQSSQSEPTQIYLHLSCVVKLFLARLSLANTLYQASMANNRLIWSSLASRGCPVHQILFGSSSMRQWQAFGHQQKFKRSNWRIWSWWLCWGSAFWSEWCHSFADTLHVLCLLVELHPYLFWPWFPLLCLQLMVWPCFITSMTLVLSSHGFST